MLYVLPYGQMSFWGATVITNLLSAIPVFGHDLVELIWGGFSVSNATLNRFFSLHYLLPFVLVALVVLHFLTLHQHGSSNPLGLSGNEDRVAFHPYFTFKDMVTVFLFFLALSIIVCFYPNLLGHSDNYIMANPMSTPASIVPEWYLLPFYAILRSIPNKLLGVIAMFSSLLILLVLPFTDKGVARSNAFKPIQNSTFWILVSTFILLTFIGSQHPEEPFVQIGQVSTLLYFLYFVGLVPVTSLMENTMADIYISINELSNKDQAGLDKVLSSTNISLNKLVPVSALSLFSLDSTCIYAELNDQIISDTVNLTSCANNYVSTVSLLNDIGMKFFGLIAGALYFLSSLVLNCSSFVLDYIEFEILVDGFNHILGFTVGVATFLFIFFCVIIVDYFNYIFMSDKTGRGRRAKGRTRRRRENEENINPGAGSVILIDPAILEWIEPIYVGDGPSEGGSNSNEGSNPSDGSNNPNDGSNNPNEGSNPNDGSNNSNNGSNDNTNQESDPNNNSNN